MLGCLSWECQRVAAAHATAVALLCDMWSEGAVGCNCCQGGLQQGSEQQGRGHTGRVSSVSHSCLVRWACSSFSASFGVGKPVRAAGCAVGKA